MSRCLTSLVLGSLSLVFATHAVAEPRLLDDREMRSVWGQASQPSSSDSQATLPGLGGNGPLGQLGNALTQNAKITMLTETQFLDTWHKLAGADSTPPTYDGRPVLQMALDGSPVSMSFSLMSLLGSLAGGTVQGPSGGTITLNNVSARGTTLWIWGH